jgi:hypothetical protein
LTERFFQEPFPKKTIATPTCLDYACYQKIPKAGTATAFFVMRDPRDLAISWYYYMRKGDHPAPEYQHYRTNLSTLTEPEGILYALRELREDGTYTALRTWFDASCSDSTIMILRYEDLIGSLQFKRFRALFDHCDITIPDADLQSLLDDYSFSKLSAGRKQGQEDTSSHYRKGISGDWRNHFDENAIHEFREITDDLVDKLGYAW